MREHADVGRTRGRGQSGDRCRHVVRARHHAPDQTVEFLIGKPGTLGHAVALPRFRQIGNRAVHVIVEGEQIDAAFGEPLRDLAFGIEIVGLVAQMEAGVGRKLRPHRFDRLQQPLRIVAAAQARLPRPGRGVIDGGDAVADRLPVAVGSATSIGKSTPARGIICRSNASPCRSTMPGSTMRPRASM